MHDLKLKYITPARRIVVKIGSQILSSERGLESRRIQGLVRDLAALHDGGREVVVVSSGAVASGMGRLGFSSRPRALPQAQALAAVGQIKLMAVYESYFAQSRKNVAQVLLTHDDLANRRRYLNAKHTLMTLLDWHIIPIVNENDTVAVEEMKFGDNDRLSALVASLLQADLLVILSDVDGLFDRDPRLHADATLIPIVNDFKAAKAATQGARTSRLGLGGMFSKVSAAEQASHSGIPTIIANGQTSGILPQVFDEHAAVGTLVLPEANRLTSRKHWILYNLKPAGDVIVDGGAYEAVAKKGRSLLASGLTEVRGSFGVGECVRCITEKGGEFARGLVNYSAQELNKIKGVHSNRIESILGYKGYEEIIHRDDLVLL